MLPIFRCTRSLGESNHDIRDTLVNAVGKTRCNASANPICAFLMPAIRLIDTRCASPKGNLNVNRVMDALLKATGDSSGVAESSCAELPSGALVAILHVPADSAGPLNVTRYLAVIRLTAPCSPVGAAAVWIPPDRLRNVPG